MNDEPIETDTEPLRVLTERAVSGKSWERENIELLAEDQLTAEARLDVMERQIKIIAGVSLCAIGVGALTLRMVTRIIAGMQNMGQVVAALHDAAQGGIQAGMQEADRMRAEPKIPETVHDPTVQPSSSGYDPGPQEVPEDVKQALENDPTAKMFLDGEDELG